MLRAKLAGIDLSPTHKIFSFYSYRVDVDTVIVSMYLDVYLHIRLATAPSRCAD